MNKNTIGKLRVIPFDRKIQKTACDILAEAQLYSDDNLVLNYLANFQNTDAIKYYTGQEYTEICSCEENADEHSFSEKRIKCPDFKMLKDETLLKCLKQRKSYRTFGDSVNKEDLLSLFAAVLSLNRDEEGRLRKSYPSGGALYPIKIVVYASKVNELEDGIYIYDSVNNELVLCNIDFAVINTEQIFQGQKIIFGESKIILFYIFDFLENYAKYFDLALSLAFIEVGAITQTMQLVAPIYKIGICDIGGFPKGKIEKWLGLNRKFYHVIHVNVLGGIQ